MLTGSLLTQTSDAEDARTRRNTMRWMRLTPPTTGTFTLSVLAILAGIAAHLGYLDALVDYEFWLVAGGAGLLVLGVLFRKL